MALVRVNPTPGPRLQVCFDSYYLPGYILDPELLFDAVMAEASFLPRSQLNFTIFGKVLQLPRCKAFYSTFEPDGSYRYYKYAAYTPTPVPFTPVLEAVRQAVSAYCGEDYNHLVVNRYL